MKEESTQFFKERLSRVATSAKETFKLIKKEKTSLAGLIIMIAIFLMPVLDFILPWDPTQHPENRFQPPSLEHPLGTDIMGRDFLRTLIRGSVDIIQLALVAAVISTAIATVAGITAGFKGGKVDTILMSIANIILTIPSFPLLAILSAFVRFSVGLLVAPIISITSWPSLARAIRSQTLSLKERDFIEAARALGLSTFHIIFSEILPNLMPYIAMSMIFAFTGAIYASVGLYYLGFLPYASVNWGVMLNIGRMRIFYPPAQMYVYVPIVLICLLQLGAILFTGCIDKIFNPRLRED